MIANKDDYARLLSLVSAFREKRSILEESFSRIKTLNNCDGNDENFNTAIRDFYLIFDFVPLMAVEIKSPLNLFRARVNEKNTLFSSETEVSYNKTSTMTIKAGRFNRPGEPMFYASLDPDPERTESEHGRIEPYYAACLETCKRLTDKENPVNLLDFTVGRWKVVKNFYVINFCCDSKHLKSNPSLNQAVDNYFEDLKESSSDEYYTFVRDFMEYFSKMSGRQSLQMREYYILTALFCAVRYYYKFYTGYEHAGLIFSSAATEQKGLNIVLTPEAVDNNLSLDVVKMLRFRRSDNNYVADSSSDMVKVRNRTFLFRRFQQLLDRDVYG